MRFRNILSLLICIAVILLQGCPRVEKLPAHPGVKGLLTYEYAGAQVLHQYSDREYVHIRLHFGWQRPEESSFATQILAVEGAFLAGAGEYSPTVLEEKLESAGATLDFVHGIDGPIVLLNCLPQRLETTWKLIETCLTKPKFERNIFQQLRASRVLRQKARDANQVSQAVSAALEMAWPASGLAEANLINGAQLEAVALTAAEETFRDLMRQRCNLRIVTIGPVEAERVSDLLANTMELLPDGECAETSNRFPAARLNTTKLIQQTIGAEAIAGIFRGPEATSRETVSMQLIMQMVEKRLRDKLVLRDHLALSASARYVMANPSYNLIVLSGANAFQCAEFTLSELRKIKNDGFAEAEVKAAKLSLLSQFAIGYEAAPNLAARLDEAAEIDAINMAGNETMILREANCKDLAAILKEYLTEISWGFVGDTSHVDRKSLHRL